MYQDNPNASDEFQRIMFGYRGLMNVLEPDEYNWMVSEMQRLDRQSLSSTGESIVKNLLTFAASGSENRERVSNLINSPAISKENQKYMKEILNKGMDEDFF